MKNVFIDAFGIAFVIFFTAVQAKTGRDKRKRKFVPRVLKGKRLQTFCKQAQISTGTEATITFGASAFEVSLFPNPY